MTTRRELHAPGPNLAPQSSAARTAARTSPARKPRSGALRAYRTRSRPRVLYPTVRSGYLRANRCRTRTGPCCRARRSRPFQITGLMACSWSQSAHVSGRHNSERSGPLPVSCPESGQRRCARQSLRAAAAPKGPELEPVLLRSGPSDCICWQASRECEQSPPPPRGVQPPVQQLLRGRRSGTRRVETADILDHVTDGRPA
jgi:hypothetical protein